jgi:hypothetical protein
MRADTEQDPFLAAPNRDYPRKETDLWLWLKDHIVPGRTTQKDVIAIFGRNYFNLDRPNRDGIITIAYDLDKLRVSSSSTIPAEYLLFDFRKDKRVVYYWFYSQAICGFCPHVFSDDGRWRLEWKMLPGFVGAHCEGSDTLLLPRLYPRWGRLRVKLANLAPEVEYIDQVSLGAVALAPGEELDVDNEGRPIVWNPGRQVFVSPDCTSTPFQKIGIALDGPARPNVLVLEVRNTQTFETAMRAHLLDGVQPVPQAALVIRFDQGRTATVSPVGTKFLRRVVIPVPARARRAHIHVRASSGGCAASGSGPADRLRLL